MIRSAMIKILLDREFRRLRKNPSAIMLIGLLSAVALLMATSRPVSNKGDHPGPNGASQSAVNVWLIYDQRSQWLDHLSENLPDTPTIRIVHRDRVPIENGSWKLPQQDAAVTSSTFRLRFFG